MEILWLIGCILGFFSFLGVVFAPGVTWHLQTRKKDDETSEEE